ncbi:MAG: NB-ARC domain-containing protein [Flavobacteriales bacterium]
MATSIFLSYARSDDEEFVRRLYDDLTVADFDVWFDRVSMPSRQLTFHQEIKDAIRTRERLILVIGPKASGSPYVTEEWAFALEADKHVIPILRMGDDYGLVPKRLSKLHCEDFRENAEYDSHLIWLLSMLQSPPPPLGALHGLPNLPPHHIPRGTLMEEVSDQLLVDLQRPVVVTGVAAIVGVHGMGGVGKSVLAVTIAQDKVIRRSFPDGIYWLSVGLHPDIAQLQHQLTVLLGNSSGGSSGSKSPEPLRGTLVDKAALIILDDVWRVEDALPFTALGPRCRLLITTRDAGILRTLGSGMAPVDLFSESEALQALADSMSVAHGALPMEAVEVVKECGRLPLAIALCGGMARKRKGDLKGILEQLRRADLERITDRTLGNEQHLSLQRMIQVSIDALTKDERDRYAELSVFPGGRQIPDQAISLLWQHTGSLDAFATEELLIGLAERSLLTEVARGADEQGRWYGVHDLLYDHALSVVGDRKSLHARFTDAAWRAREAKDPRYRGYVREHLAPHLAKADEPDRLITLLADPENDLFHFWAEQGSAQEGRECLEFMVDAMERSGKDDVLLAGLAVQLVRLNNRLGDHEAAERWLKYVLERGTALYRMDLIIAVAMHEKGSRALAMGSYAEAHDGFMQALHIAHKHEPPSPREIAANLIGLAGVTYLVNGRRDRTVTLASLALKNAETVEDAAHAAEACRILGDVCKDDMQHALAEEYLDRGLAMVEGAKLVAAKLSLLLARAWCTYQKVVLEDRPAHEARSVFEALRAFADETGDWRFAADAWSGLGQCALIGDDEVLLQDAILHLNASAGAGLPSHLQARLGLFNAALHHRARRYAEAEAAYVKVGAMAKANGLWSRQVDALLGQGAAMFHGERKDEAEKCWATAQEILPHCPRVRELIVERFLGKCREDGRVCPM